jgi:hypothetical protein
MLWNISIHPNQVFRYILGIVDSQIVHNLSAMGVILAAAMINANPPKYKPNPTIRLPLKPITIEDMAVNTDPITQLISGINAEFDDYVDAQLVTLFSIS